MAKKAAFHSIKDILGKLAHSGKWNSKIRQYTFFAEWENIVGPKIARHAQPKIWQGSTLVVEVLSSAWLMELKMMEKDLLEKIRKDLPETKVERIKWMLR